MILGKFVYGLKEMYFLDSQNLLHTIAELCVIVDDRWAHRTVSGFSFIENPTPCICYLGFDMVLWDEGVDISDAIF